MLGVCVCVGGGRDRKLILELVTRVRHLNNFVIKSPTCPSLQYSGRGGGGEREVQGTGSDFRHAPDLTVRP